MTWLWKQGIPTLATSRQLPVSLSLTPGYSALPEIVPRLKPTQGFHTLGLYITPSENYATRAKVLRGYAERFNSQLKQSHLTPQEVYCCYMQYIRPKITYPFPCVSLTEKQCRHIQAPVLAAVLPRLPLNWHTPRAVLFAGPRYGGLGLSENYTDLGIGHLQYLVGHIKMGDEVGQLLLSSITHTQLQVGSVTPFFKLAYPRYVKWIDSTWIMDVWKFTNQAKVVIDVEKHWLPCLPCKHDAALMDLALTFNLNADQLKSINLCRLYLQVITVSNITNATGDRLLASAMAGFRDNQRSSTLLWPDIPQPPSSHWNTWRVFLQFFSKGSNLKQALGPWENRPHYEWRWFVDSVHNVWEHDLAASLWHRYVPLQSSGRRTRSRRRQYLQCTQSTERHPPDLLPITIIQSQDGSFVLQASSTPLIASSVPPVPDLW